MGNINRSDPYVVNILESSRTGGKFRERLCHEFMKRAFKHGGVGSRTALRQMAADDRQIGKLQINLKWRVSIRGRYITR